MLIRLFLASIVMLTVFATAALAAPTHRQLDRVTGQLIMPNGSVCSGTVYRKVIIASSHCVDDQPVEVRFRKQNMRVTKYMLGRSGENVMIKVDADLGPSARLGRRPKLGAQLWIIGNPMGLEQVFREGRLSSRVQDLLLIDCRCWHGDSGAGVFDDTGALVGVFYGAVLDKHLLGSVQFSMPYAYPLDFTRQQWSEASR